MKNQNLTITQLQLRFGATTSKCFNKAHAMKTKAYLTYNEANLTHIYEESVFTANPWLHNEWCDWKDISFRYG